MSKLTFPHLDTLVPDMLDKGVDKEHFAFDYSKQTIDCVFGFNNGRYELLVGIHALNFGFVVDIYKNTSGLYVAEISDESYLDFCRILNLSYRGDGFTSNKLLVLLSSKTPTYSLGIKMSYKTMRQYIKCRHVEEAEKIYFKGWNDHIKDGKTARNFDKTEFYMGSNVAKYCREHNVSSMWTDVPMDEVSYHDPWE